MSSPPKKVKVVCIGDGAVGKTCLLISYTKGEFPSEYIPTIFDNYSATVSLKSGGSIQLNLWDTAGQEDYDHIRALAYKDVDCFLVCFSVDSQSSFSNVKQKWIPSIMDSESSDASIILVGTKQDLRNDKKILSSLQAKGSSFVSEEDAKDLTLKIHADAYLECSALLQDGLKECMQEAVSASIKKRSRMKKKKKNGGCLIL